MIPNSADIAQAANLLEQVIAQAVVRPTGAPMLTGISGFLFDIIDGEDVSFDSDITDHYVEDNVAIQDHIALRAERFTVRGFAGEICDKFSESMRIAISIIEKVAIISTMAPQFITQAEQLYAQLTAGAKNIGQLINTASSLYDIFAQAITTATRQQAAFNYFYSLWLSRQLCTVETPWNVFTDMAIESVRGRQNGETRMISEFSVTFKKIRKVNMAVSVGFTKYAGRTADMISNIVASGVTSGQDIPAGATISQLWSDPRDFAFSQTKAQILDRMSIGPRG